MNSNYQDIKLIWKEVSLELKEDIGFTEYNCWIKPINIYKHTVDEVVFSVPTLFIKDYINDNLKFKIKEILQRKIAIKDIKVIVANQLFRRSKVASIDFESGSKVSSFSEKINSKSYKYEYNTKVNSSISSNKQISFFCTI